MQQKTALKLLLKCLARYAVARHGVCTLRLEAKFYNFSNTDTSVWTIPELSLKDAGEYECRVISNNGNYSVKTRVETRESPPEIFGVRNVSVPLGEAAFLHCSTRSAGEVEIRWTRYGATVFNGPNTERNPTNGTLKIHHVTRADAGVYECMARNAGGMSTRKMRLDVSFSRCGYRKKTITIILDYGTTICQSYSTRRLL